MIPPRTIHHRWSPLIRPLAGAAWSAALLGVVACGGGGRKLPGAAPVRSANEAVRTFMEAVADSNLTKMAQLWGTSKGSAAQTGQPSDYERRIVLMQSYLRYDDYRIVSDIQNAGRWEGQIEIRRQVCTWIVPFVAAQTGTGGWVITNIDLTKAGNPVRPCDPNAPRDSVGN